MSTANESPRTVRSDAAAKELMRPMYDGTGISESECSAVIASHYAELEDAAKLARDALGLKDTPRTWGRIAEAQAALDAVLGKKP